VVDYHDAGCQCVADFPSEYKFEGSSAVITGARE
jgi:hypothetical protein